MTGNDQGSNEIQKGWRGRSQQKENGMIVWDELNDDEKYGKITRTVRFSTRASLQSRASAGPTTGPTGVNIPGFWVSIKYDDRSSDNIRYALSPFQFRSFLDDYDLLCRYPAGYYEALMSVNDVISQIEETLGVNYHGFQESILQESGTSLGSEDDISNSLSSLALTQ